MFQVVREDEQGTITYAELFETGVVASDRAAERWAEENNGFLAFPIFYVIDTFGHRCVDPIDCRP